MAAVGGEVMSLDLQVNVATSLTFLSLLAVCILGGVWRERAWLQAAARRVLPLLRLRAIWKRPAPVDPIEQRVVAMRCQRRVERSRGIVLFNICMAMLFEVVLVVHLFTRCAMMPLGQLVAMHALIFTFMVQHAFPWLVTASTIDFHYWWSILLLAAAAAFQEEGYAMSLWVFAFCCCLFNLNSWVNVAGLVLVGGTRAIMGSSQVLDSRMMSAGVSMIIVAIDQMLTAGLRLEIRAMDSGQELAAVKTLLGGICDVVVELDECLRLTQHSPRLSDILLHGSGRSLQGAAIQEFMPAEDDREKFAEHLGSADKAPSHAQVFHAKISDSNATLISMEFFSVALVGSDTRRRYLLGMREFTDIQPLTPSPELRPLRQPVPPQERPPRTNWPGTPANAGSGSSMSGSSLQLEREPEEKSQASAASSRGSRGSLARAAERAARPRRETHDLAMQLTLVSTLLSWQVKAPEGSCCPLHAAATEALRIVGLLGAWPCRPSFGPLGDWQCQVCGIANDEYRMRGGGGRARGCNLCVDTPILASRRSGGSASPSMMASL